VWRWVDTFRDLSRGEPIVIDTDLRPDDAAARILDGMHAGRGKRTFGERMASMGEPRVMGRCAVDGMVLYCRNVPRPNGMPGDRYGAMVLVGRIIASGYGSRLSGVFHPRSGRIATVPILMGVALLTFLIGLPATIIGRAPVGAIVVVVVPLVLFTLSRILIDVVVNECRRERTFLASWLRERLAPDRP
jgi:hypothetical protein